MENDESTTETAPRRAFLIGVQHPQETEETPREMLAELHELVNTLGLETVGETLAHIREPHPATILGTGKTEELIQKARELQADVIILDDFLTPAQQRNWEKLAGGASVIDRQEVILEIFDGRAHTREAALQVELAKANYALPRIRHKWLNLSRQRGAAGGLGGRAGGEQQLELDSRKIRKRVAWLKEQLTEVQKHRAVQRSSRLGKPVPVVAIIGYTNAGKSSLLNQMTNAGILAEDKLFATLDPTVRKYRVPGGQDILLADTVGFIRKLPHLLIEAFKSTLEETRLADVILEIIDATSPEWKAHHETTRQVLQEIGAGHQPILLAFNKIDRLTSEARRALQTEIPEDALCISAKTGEGLKLLGKRLAEQTSSSMILCSFLLPHTEYGELAQMRKVGYVETESYEEDGIHLQIRIPEPYLIRWRKFLTSP